MKRMQIILLGVFFSSKIVSQDIDLRVDTSEYLKSREYDTIANGIAGNNHFEFNYKTSQIIKKYTTINTVTGIATYLCTLNLLI